MTAKAVDIDSIQRPILGSSPLVVALKKMIERVAPSNTNILIMGESGTGKELVARALHELSPAAQATFVAVNCGAIPENLIESELFGHKKGSFTGAVADKPGLFEVASGGTLFLDEIGELPLTMQVKLLRALQDKAIRRVGGNETIKVDVRIVAATNRDLETAASKGEFREDLFYRLNVIALETPPLRLRGNDVESLAMIFLKKFSEKQNRKIDGFSPDTLEILLKHTWPGNVRELENVMERVVTLETENEIQVATLPPEMVAEAKKRAGIPREMVLRANFLAGAVDIDQILADVKKFYEREALVFTKNNAEKADALLGIQKK